MCLKNLETISCYGLCPSHYLSAPLLRWDAIFNMIKVDLELFSDANMYLFFTKGIREGVSYISRRNIKARNNYLKSYDPKQELKHFIYLDATNLYSHAISKFLPTSRYKWINSKKHTKKCSSNSSKGCVLESDLEYPKELRELHHDHLLVPDKIEIKKETSSSYQLKIADFYNFDIGNVKKETCYKETCMLQCENVQLYLKLGLKLKKYTCIITQSIIMTRTIC